MRFMIIVKATADSEAGVMPSEELITEMGKFNEELVKAGVLLAGDGLHPSSQGRAGDVLGRQAHRGRRAVRRDQGARRGLLAVAGGSHGRGHRVGQALPQPDAASDSVIEIRQIFEPEDFGEAFTPELRARPRRGSASSSPPSE